MLPSSLPPDDHVPEKAGPQTAASKGPPSACLFVASLAPDATEEALRSLFSCHGKVLKVRVLKDRLNRSYAFVQFETTEEADAALAATSGQPHMGRKLRVERARVNTTLFVAKLPRNFTSAELREAAAEFGPVENVTIIKNHQTNKSKGCGFVKFVYREDAMDAYLEWKNIGKRWVTEWATSTNGPDGLGVDKQNIFVGGLHPELATKEALEERFSQYGTIDNVTLITRSEGDNAGEASSQRGAFAFLRFRDPHAASSCIEHEDGAEWFERKIRVQYCESQEMKTRRKASQSMTSVMNMRKQMYAGVSLPQPPLLMMNGIPAVSFLPSMQNYTAPFAKGSMPARPNERVPHYVPNATGASLFPSPFAQFQYYNPPAPQAPHGNENPNPTMMKSVRMSVQHGRVPPPTKTW